MKETDKRYKQSKKTKIEIYGDCISVVFHEKKIIANLLNQVFIAVLEQRANSHSRANSIQLPASHSVSSVHLMILCPHLRRSFPMWHLHSSFTSSIYISNFPRTDNIYRVWNVFEVPSLEDSTANRYVIVRNLLGIIFDVYGKQFCCAGGLTEHTGLRQCSELLGFCTLPSSGILKTLISPN
jgi:hypothetical protein